jgi:hypothetical protein
MRFKLIFMFTLILPLSATDVCSTRAGDSVPGQFIDQMLLTLNLSTEQITEVVAAQDLFYPEFDARSQLLQSYRFQFFQDFKTAADDGILTEEEKNQLKQKRQVILNEVALQKALIQDTASRIRSYLTEEQLLALSSFKADLTIPQDVQDTGKTLLDSITTLLEGYALTGFLNPVQVQIVKNNLNAFLDSVYIPDWLVSRVEFWQEQIDNANLGKLVRARISRTDAIKLTMLFKTLGNLDINNFTKIQDLPVYRLLVQDLMVNMALLAPITHCRLTGNAPFAP